MSASRTVAGYFLLQAVGVLGWWVLLWRVPASRGWFIPDAWPASTLLSFWLPDLAMLVGGSAMVASAVWRASAWASSGVWALAAAAWYPTLYCIAASLMTGQAWVSASLMCCMAGLSLAMATVYGHRHQQPAAFRVTAMGPGRALEWTLLQVVVFWGVFLGVLPQGVAEVEAAVGVERFSHLGQRVGAGVFFGLASALGLWSAAAMAVRGRGTPLPTATAPQLVVDGPYRGVRNPMALAGITQGLAIGWGMGSAAVLAYAVSGGLVWHVAVRPAEERELLGRFGEAYEAYRRRVGLWVPRLPGLGRRANHSTFGGV